MSALLRSIAGRWVTRRKPDSYHRLLMRELRRFDPENPTLRFVEEAFRG